MCECKDALEKLLKILSDKKILTSEEEVEVYEMLYQEGWAMTFYDKYPKLAYRKEELGRNENKTDKEYKEWDFLVSVMMIDDVLESFENGNRKFMSHDVGMVEAYAKDLFENSKAARLFLKKNKSWGMSYV